MSKKVLFALTSHEDLGGTGRKTGFYVPEVAHPAVVFRQAGYDIDYVSVAGGNPPRDGIDANDAVVGEFLSNDAVASALATTPTPDQVKASDYDVIYFAGGHGTMWDFPRSAALRKLAAEVYEGGGVVAAVCHGPAALVNLTLSDGSHLIEGRQVAGFTNEEEAAVGLTEVVPFLLEDGLVQAGAKFTKAGTFQAHAVADGRLVTGQNPASATRVAELALEALETR